jgi:lysophospholipase L1-like esterase
MPLGDSITAWQESYRGHLFTWLGSTGRRVDFVGSQQWAPIGGTDADHEAHGGYTIGPDSNIDWLGNPGNLAQRVGVWIPAARPDVIILAVGANDIAGGGTQASEAPTRLRNLVAQLQRLAPTAWIIVGDLTPTRWSPTGSPTIDALNAASRSIGEASSSDRVVWGNTLAGLRSLGFDLNTDLQDASHLSVSGGQKYAQAWRPTVSAAVDAVGCPSNP